MSQRFPPHGNLPGMNPQAMIQRFQELLNARSNGSASPNMPLPMPGGLPYSLSTTAPGVVNPALLAQVTASMNSGLPGGLVTTGGFPPSTMPSIMPSQQHHLNISPQRDSMGSPNGKKFLATSRAKEALRKNFPLPSLGFIKYQYYSELLRVPLGF